ncbi:MAG: MFS transporter [Burkholderiales bacterium]
MASVFVVALGYGVALPILPFFLKTLLADSGRYSVSSHVGMITGIFAFAMFLFAPLWGRLSDKVGRRPVILVGLGGFVVMLGIFGLSPNLWFAYASRILAGLFASAILPVASAYIADMGAPELRARRFAWMGTAGLLGFLAGPMLGGWLSDASGQWLSSLAGRMGVNLVSMPFLVAAALGAAVWLLTYLEMPRHAGNTTTLPATDKPFASHDSRSVNALLLLTLLMTFGLGSFEVGLTLHGQQSLSLGPGRLSQLFVACMLAMIATQMLVFPFLIKRWPVHVIAPPAFAIMAGGLILLPAASDFGRLLVAVGLVAAGSGLLAPIMSYRISLAAGSAQGAVLGKQAAASSLGQAIGSVVAGIGFGLMNREPFWASAGLLLIGAALSAATSLFSAQPATKVP